MTDQGFSKPEKSIPVFEKEKQAQIEARKKEYAQLIKPLPEKAIKPHETKSFLSTVNPQCIIERLHKFFGWNGWSHECIEEVVDDITDEIPF